MVLFICIIPLAIDSDRKKIGEILYAHEKCGNRIGEIWKENWENIDRK